MIGTVAMGFTRDFGHLSGNLVRQWARIAPYLIIS